MGWKLLKQVVKFFQQEGEDCKGPNMVRTAVSYTRGTQPSEWPIAAVQPTGQPVLKPLQLQGSRN